MRWIRAGAIAAVVALSACTSGSSGGSSGGGVDPSLGKVQSANKVTICTSNDVPYAYKDPASGKLTGTDVDMDIAILKHMNIANIDMFTVPISGIIPALLSGRCDMISDNIAITLKRSQQISFSTPMYRAGQALVVPKGNPANIHTERDFSHHTVGSYLGTIQLDWLKQLAASDPTITVKAYKDIPEILADLQAKRLDAAVFDDMVAGYSLKQDPSLPIEQINYKLPIGDYAVGAGFRKEDVSFREAFDEANRQIEVKGELTEVLQKWGLLPVDRYYPFPNCCQ
jgi:polar amino acid transport system substrate-binding protein